MTTLHLILILAAGKTFVDEKGDKVVLVRELDEMDAEYVQGFRYVGDNKTKYTADGGVVGHLGQIDIKQIGAYPLVREYVETDHQPHHTIRDGSAYEDLRGKRIFAREYTGPSSFDDTVVLQDQELTLEEGKFYRNGLGQAVLIIGTPKEGGHWWNKGYRFMDQMGTFYKPNGKVDSWLWGVLDIVMPITDDTPLSEQVTDEEMAKIRKGVQKQIDRMNGKYFSINVKKIANNAFFKTGLFCKKSLKGMGVAYAAMAAGFASKGDNKTAAVLAAMSAFIFWYDKTSGPVSDWEKIIDRNLIA